MNVTAGLDLSIGEFDEVGKAVKEFSSDDATVVVGTVIDPEMQGEMRVTVVATGLGQSSARRQEPEVRVVRTAVPKAAAGGEPDYRDLDRPAIQRRRAVGQEFAGHYDNEELLDIPAFLRRQAD